ncbi:hypothetical protein HYH02_002145 [Chlamydomonas schloesseri]|uniref:DNA-directed RNA polymerase III subunit RPC3 n=1 Tax=Chlamydomonas schloesseri TaxID=2026947 RepID=A0A835WTY9_9CHLO|nr:hypothetical protein HYH02_002145 [Chlamydomonas schloesseri]|eukprot:KAG2453942.1 hypothetical protein HYH02_002145 [Chlamydomonas schloesseri]
MSTRKQYACDLACRLVQDQYGDAVGKVFKQLVSKGQLQLGDIVRGTGMPPALVKQALLILIQQNCINCYLQPGEETLRGPRPSFHLYEANTDRVLQIIRHPRFLLHIKDEAGEVAEAVIGQLLQEGRLRMDQVLGSVAARLGKALDKETRDGISNTFISLVQAHYVERSPPCTLPPPAVRPHPNSVRTRKAKSAAGNTEGYAADQAAALKSFEELSFEKQRFKVPAELALEMFMSDVPAAGAAAAAAGADGANGGGAADADGADGSGDEEGGGGGGGRAASPDVKMEDAEEAAAAGGGGGGKGGGGGRKKRPAPDDDDELAIKITAPAKKAKMRAGTARPDVSPSPGSQSPVRAGAGGVAGPGGRAASPGSPVPEPAVVLWRVNNDEFNRRFRHQAIVGLVREKFDEDSASVVSAMLAAGRPFESSVKEERSVQLSEDEVEATANKLANAGIIPSMAGVSVTTVLRTLANDGFEMFSHVGTGPQGSASYVVNSQRVIDLIMLKQTEAVVKARFDVAGLRVFRLLALRGQLEQKQIADLAMLPAKDTREMLYTMLQGGFVMLQDIPKTADRAPSRTFYTWRVNMQSLSDSTAAQLYRAAGRVWQRLKFELEKEKDLLALIESAKETRTVNFTLTTAQRQAVARLKRVSEVMETSLAHLDEMISIFNDF